MSMVRFLTYANQWDIEGLVATTSVHQKDKTAALAHPRDRPGLRKGARQPGDARAGLPDGRRICCRSFSEGRPAYGMAAVGAGKDSPGSDRLIAVVDRDDPRPLWVPVWGGPNCSRRRSGRCAPRGRRRRWPGSSRSCASTRSPTRTTAGPGSGRRSPTSSTSPARASTPAAPITTPRGAASAATTSTAASPAPTSASSTIHGSTSTSGARDRSALSTRARSS